MKKDKRKKDSGRRNHAHRAHEEVLTSTQQYVSIAAEYVLRGERIEREGRGGEGREGREGGREDTGGNKRGDKERGRY
jgi:hypothetical protein